MENNILGNNQKREGSVDISGLDYLTPEERLRLARMLPELQKIFGKLASEPLDDLGIKINKLGNILGKLPRDLTPEEIRLAILKQEDVIEVLQR